MPKTSTLSNSKSINGSLHPCLLDLCLLVRTYLRLSVILKKCATHTVDSIVHMYNIYVSLQLRTPLSLQKIKMIELNFHLATFSFVPLACSSCQPQTFVLSVIVFWFVDRVFIPVDMYVYVFNHGKYMNIRWDRSHLTNSTNL